jgi:thymidylate synthase (FAD)
MNVKLVAITQPKIEGLKSAEDIISYCARVSNPSNQMNTETAPRLVKYLIKHQHWSPFEMASVTIEIVTSRAIAAQILRHRSFAFQEFSQRYSVATKLEDIQWRLQGKTNRQVGDTEVDLSPEKKQLVDKALNSSLEAYDALIQAGVAKECARMVLPLTTQTTMYMTGTIRSWIHYIELRAKEDTQKEHRDIAIGIRNIFVDEFPVISEALEWKKV